ncbi:unnamed protein product [Caenorhabditis nigoni]
MTQQSEQIKMNTSAVVISVVGFVSGLVTCFMNIILLKTYIKKKNDMTLFYYRFTIDMILGALLSSYLSLIVLYLFFVNQLSEYHNFIFYLSLPASNVLACRSIIVLSVAIERMVAAYAPIFFHNYRHRCPTIIILILAVIFGLTEDIVLYEFCDFHLNIPKNCAAFGCAINSCFLNYWTFHKATIFASICIFSLLLCIKLFVMKTGGVEFSRAAYAPIFFHNYRRRFPNILILILAVIFGLTEDVVLYGFCDFHLNIPKNCAAFGCAINSCFLSYCTTHKAIIFASICIFSLLLCIKLFILKTEDTEFSRLNRLAIIETAIVVMFDFLPSLIARQTSKTEFLSFQNIGPYVAVTKLFGCAIEAILIV